MLLIAYAQKYHTICIVVQKPSTGHEAPLLYN